jgi:hypothetical protein
VPCILSNTVSGLVVSISDTFPVIVPLLPPGGPLPQAMRAET